MGLPEIKEKKDFCFTLDQMKAFRALEGQANLFITGQAGTGKSFIIQEFLKIQIRPIPVLASTGAAAILIGGRTFHSFFSLGILQGGADRAFEKAVKDRRLKKRLR